MSRLPRIACSWCGNGPESGETTAPCGKCLDYAGQHIAASTTGADPLYRTEQEVTAARVAVKAAKKALRKAERRYRGEPIACLPDHVRAAVADGGWFGAIVNGRRYPDEFAPILPKQTT